LGTPSKLRALAWTFVWGVLFVALVLVSVHLSEGRLIYSLDDPYIHLAVAEHIAHGGYGVNASEFSSPSSSILYPILLVPTLALGLGTAGPLVINTLATGLSVWLLLEFFWRYAVGETVRRTVFAHMVCPFLILAINAFALPMTGMEHSLHVLTVIVTVRGLVAMIESGDVSVSLVVAIICMPFLRFEGVALAGAAILVMVVVGNLRAAGLVSAAILAGFGIYAAVMQHLVLPFLPSSVLLKSELAASVQEGMTPARIIKTVLSNLSMSYADRWGKVFALVVCALLVSAQDCRARWRSLTSPEVLIGGTMVLGLGAHLVAGHYGWFYRYEVYAVAILVCGGIYVLRLALVRLQGKNYIVAQTGVLLALAVLVSPYAYAAYLSPRASRNIYEQQFQMHRFATEFFPRRVAVNDLGWVSYDNKAFVLDLWGLGSETVRKLRAAGQINADAIADLTNKADIDFAMIYKSWFEGSIPDSWCLMAILQGEQITAASGEVLFYATRASAVADMRDALDRFASTLPARVTLKRLSCARP
jgi:hypothetical protein